MQMIVFSTPKEGREEEYNTWYTDVHIPELLAIDGVTSATRYSAPEMPGQGAEHTYMAVYEIDGDPLKVLAQLRENATSGKSKTSDAVDPKNTRITFWEPMK
ncbi:MAG: hypothetical protein J2P18_00825 [Nocardia sp.]|nr:hypothetical protein [Nocardia sp.]